MRSSIHTTIFLLSSLIILSCSGNKGGAKEYLLEAEKAYKEGNFSLSKLKIDSIKVLFPESFDEINAGFDLMQEVRMAENKRNILFCDSMLRENYNQLNEMLTRFDYVRDSRYQEFGEYYPKVFPHHSSFSRNGLRSGVREKGTLFIESVVSGIALKHYKIKVTTADGSFAETNAVTADGLNYQFNTSNNSYEVVRYSGSDENGVAQFIHTFQYKPITVHFIGRRTTSTPLTPAAKEGIADSYELSTLLLNIEQLKFEKEKSDALIRYLESRAK